MYQAVVRLGSIIYSRLGGSNSTLIVHWLHPDVARLITYYFHVFVPIHCTFSINSGSYLHYFRYFVTNSCLTKRLEVSTSSSYSTVLPCFRVSILWALLYHLIHRTNIIVPHIDYFNQFGVHGPLFSIVYSTPWSGKFADSSPLYLWVVSLRDFFFSYVVRAATSGVSASSSKDIMFSLWDPFFVPLRFSISCAYFVSLGVVISNYVTNTTRSKLILSVTFSTLCMTQFFSFTSVTLLGLVEMGASFFLGSYVVC